MEENGNKHTAITAVREKQKMKKQRKSKVVLEKLTSIALKMREIRRKATQPTSVKLN